MRAFAPAAVLIAFLVAACGASGSAAPSPSPTPSSGVAFDVIATEQDHAVTMRVGQTLEVVLHGGVSTTWQQVASSDTSILQPIVDTKATPVRGVTLAAFRARAAGQAKVNAVGVPVCPSGKACPMYAILYTLEVTVTQ